MSQINRRQAIQTIGGAVVGGAAAMALAPNAFGQIGSARPHVVVVGGGFGGATAARYLRHWSQGSVDVTLVDSNPHHTSSILSNLVLNGQLGIADLTFGFDDLASGFGVSIRQGTVTSINPSSRSITLAGAGSLGYDRLILSPGIDFIPIAGLDHDLVPHAWKAGPQTTLLKQQLDAMPDGGTFVLSIPKAPYRCPPGPYERACVVADYIRRTKGGGQVIVLDSNPGIIIEPETFGHAFDVTYAGLVDYRPNSPVVEVDSARRIATTGDGAVVAGDVLNVIPPHRAPALLHEAGLVNDPSGRWAGVDLLTYESTAQPNIHVIGDSHASKQPKAGHMANSQGKVVSDAVLRTFDGLAPNPNPVTNSACYSPISSDTASWLTAVFRYDPADRQMKLIPESFAAGHPTAGNYDDMFAWTDNLFADTFGVQRGTYHHD